MSLGENKLGNFYLDDIDQYDNTSLQGASNSLTHLPLLTIDPYIINNTGQQTF